MFLKNIDFEQYQELHDIVYQIKEKGEFEDSLNSYFEGNLYSKGCSLPWTKTRETIALRPSEVSIWAGINGHGKSLLLGQVVLSLLEQKQKCLIASFEMRPEVTLARMARQAIGIKKPSQNAVKSFSEWLPDQLYIYDHHGMIESYQMLAVCRYAHEVLGLNHIVIDSLMKCVRGEDSYNEQKDFVNELCSIARATGMHIHLVHHIRKANDEKQISGKFDLKGSGSISDQADNVFIVWKNKEKAQIVATQPGYFDREEPDAMLVCEKQRNGEFEGRIKLWFDYKSQQFIESADTPIHDYLRGN